MTSSAAIELEGVSVGYNGDPVVRELSIEVAPGEVVGLLGPNGAGKTTTLRTISAEVKPSAGTVRVMGEPTGSVSVQQLARRGLAHVAEQGNHFASLTVAENLRLAFPKPRAARVEATELTFHLFPALEGLMSRPAGLLSGGEQQMLAMAQAIAPRPKVMLIDELSLGLAPVIVEQLLPTVRKAASETGCAVVLVEQHIPMALEVVDRAYVLSQGRIQMKGDAVELSKRRDLLTSSYLGEEVTIEHDEVQV